MENELANLIVDLNQRLASKEQELVAVKRENERLREAVENRNKAIALHIDELSQSQERCRELEQKLSGYEENKPPIS